MFVQSNLGSGEPLVEVGRALFQQSTPSSGVQQQRSSPAVAANHQAAAGGQRWSLSGFWARQEQQVGGSGGRHIDVEVAKFEEVAQAALPGTEAGVELHLAKLHAVQRAMQRGELSRMQPASRSAPGSRLSTHAAAAGSQAWSPSELSEFWARQQSRGRDIEVEISKYDKLAKTVPPGTEGKLELHLAKLRAAEHAMQRGEMLRGQAASQGTPASDASAGAGAGRSPTVQPGSAAAPTNASPAAALAAASPACSCSPAAGGSLAIGDSSVECGHMMSQASKQASVEVEHRQQSGSGGARQPSPLESRGSPSSRHSGSPGNARGGHGSPEGQQEALACSQAAPEAAPQQHSQAAVQHQADSSGASPAAADAGQTVQLAADAPAGSDAAPQHGGQPPAVVDAGADTPASKAAKPAAAEKPKVGPVTSPALCSCIN